MKNLLIVCVVSLTASCSSIDKGKQVISDAHEALQVLKDKAAEGKQAYDDYMAKVEAERARFEAVTGPWDRNRDGEVDVVEVIEVLKSTATRAATSGSDRDFLADHWAELLGVMGTTLASGWLGLKVNDKRKAAVARAKHVDGQIANGT